MKSFKYRRIRPGDVICCDPHTEVTHVERSSTRGQGAFAHTHWVTVVRDIAEGEYADYVEEDLLGLPSDMPVDDELTPRYDERGHQVGGMCMSYELMKLSEGGKISPRDVQTYLAGTDVDYSKRRRAAQEIASSGSYRKSA